jgi:hypothetical protein
LLHRHRDLLYRIYEGHIGDMHAVPLGAGAAARDRRPDARSPHRLLLSRIDGMLSFEDILDVAGMPAHGGISRSFPNLLRKGVIEVR